eukprot:COSAG06_NODE_38885_length_418_cov_1.429467_1_plen_104_part_01
MVSAPQLLERLEQRFVVEGRAALRVVMAAAQRIQKAREQPQPLDWGFLFRQHGSSGLDGGGCVDWRRFHCVVVHCCAAVTAAEAAKSKKLAQACVLLTGAKPKK